MFHSLIRSKWIESFFLNILIGESFWKSQTTLLTASLYWNRLWWLKYNINSVRFKRFNNWINSFLWPFNAPRLWGKTFHFFVSRMYTPIFYVFTVSFYGYLMFPFYKTTSKPQLRFLTETHTDSKMLYKCDWKCKDY